MNRRGFLFYIAGMLAFFRFIHLKYDDPGKQARSLPKTDLKNRPGACSECHSCTARFCRYHPAAKSG